MTAQSNKEFYDEDIIEVRIYDEVVAIMSYPEYYNEYRLQMSTGDYHVHTIELASEENVAAYIEATDEYYYLD